MKLKKIISTILAMILFVTFLPLDSLRTDEVYAAEKKLSKVTSLAQKSPYSTTSITMSWKKHKDATGYEVYRSTSVKGKYTKVKATTSTSYKQGKLTRGKTYYYKVRAYKIVNGNKINGSFSSVKAMGTKPQTPGIKAYSGVGKAKVEWKKISGISGYEIYMSSSKTGAYKKIKTVGSKTTEYLKTGLTGGTEYFFKIRSYRTVGGKRIYSSWSSIKSVKVKKISTEAVKVTGVSLNKTTVTLNKGASTTLTATVAPSNATNKSVSWSSSNTSVAKVSNGKITAVGKGMATITVNTADGGKVAYCNVKVNEPDTPLTHIAVTGIELNFATIYNMPIGESQTLVATVIPSDATNKSVIWSSSDESVATVNNGLITAVSRGQTEIIVKTADGGKEAVCYVSVYDYSYKEPNDEISVTGVTLSKTSLTLNKGGSTTLTATVAPSNATNKSVTWSSSNTSVATVSNGTIKAVGKGTATITAKTADGGKTATCAVTVNVPVTSVSLNKSSVTLNKGGSTTLTATVNPSDASNKSVTWSSSNTSVATVSNGTIKAVGKGSATITVKTVDGSKAATCKVTVNVPVTGISITNKKDLPLDFNSSTNNTYQCNISISPSDANNKSVTWTSSDSSVATVSSSGKITALKRGTTTITVKTADGGKTDSFKVYVYKSNPAVPGGGNVYLKLKLASNQSLVMDVENGTTANGTKVKLWTSNGSDAQLWQFHDYKSKYGGLAGVPRCNTGSYILDANRGGNNYSDALKAGCSIDLWTLGQDNAASMWEIVKIWDDSYIIKLINSNLAIGTTSATAGTQLTLKTFNVFDTNQRWFVEGVNTNSSSDPVTQKIAELRTRYKHGQYWNKYNGLNQTGTNICPCGNGTCPTYCACTCGEFQFNGQPIAWQCHGFALKMAYEIWGENANNWSRHTNVNSIYAGDVIRINNDGHSIFVIKVDGNNIYYVDCNYTGRCKVRWDGVYTRSQLSGIVTYIAHKSGNISLGK